MSVIYKRVNVMDMQPITGENLVRLLYVPIGGGTGKIVEVDYGQTTPSKATLEELNEHFKNARSISDAAN